MIERNTAATEVATEAAKWMNEDMSRTWFDVFLKFGLTKKTVEELSGVAVTQRVN